jgi:putative membrane protein (TIGR04086 family)
MKKKFPGARSSKSYKSSKPKNESAGITQLIKAVAYGAGAGLLCFLCLLLVFSAISMKAGNPHALMTPLSLTSLYVSSFVCGIVCARKNAKKSLLLSALISGTCFTALLCAIFLLSGSLLPSGENIKGAFIFRLLMIPCSLLGAFSTARRGSQRKRKRH